MSSLPLSVPSSGRPTGEWRSADLFVFGLFGLAPLLIVWVGEPFYLTLLSRIMVIGLAAVGLNLVLGLGGMVSLGHALYLGVGAYAVGILAVSGVTDAFVQLIVMLVAVTSIATLVGWISLRTNGFSFIMITMAFGQMFYYLAISLKQYGGDQGLSLKGRSLVFGSPVLENPVVLYYVIFALVAATVALIGRLALSPFGLVLRGQRQNQSRVSGLGYPLLRYQLAAYVLSALPCGLAGFLLANLTFFASPEYMSWTQSGTLVVMSVLGGLSTVLGPLVGAAAILLLEETLSSVTDHWMVVLGPMIVAIMLLSARGLCGRLQGRAL